MTAHAGNITPAIAGDLQGVSAEPLDRWHDAAGEHWAAEWGVPAVYLFRRVCSTNNVARALAASGAPHGSVVIAEEQLRGRGQHGRPWISAAGMGLWMTLLFRPTSAEWQVSLAPVIAGLAAARALDAYSDVLLEVKWPNDLLLNHRKVGGILCEGVWQGAGIKEAFVGIGLNLHHDREDFPPELQEKATSMKRETGRTPHTPELAGHAVRALIAALGVPRLTLRPEWIAEMQKRDSLRGRRVIAQPAGNASAVVGIGAGIAQDGALIVCLPTGRHVRMASGSVRLAPAAAQPPSAPAARSPSFTS